MYIRVSPLIYDRLKKLNELTGYTMNVLISTAIVVYISELEKELKAKGKM